MPQAIAEDIDWIAILIFKPLKKPIAPSYWNILRAVSKTLVYFILTSFSEDMLIRTLKSL